MGVRGRRGGSIGLSISRRRFVMAAGGAAVAGLALEGLVLEPRRLDVTHHDLGDPRGDRRVRIVHLTDLHLGSVGSLQERIAEHVHAADPDVVVLTGDSVEETRAMPELLAFLELLPRTAVLLATLGNWEYWSRLDLGALESVYARGDCRLLVDAAARLTVGDARITVVGLDDLVGGSPDVQKAARSAASLDNVLVLAHCPAHRDVIARDGLLDPVAILSGHTHGGQVAVGGWAPVVPRGSGPYVSGWYRDSGPDLYVSRGLGTSVIPLRLGSVPEIAVLDWYL